jgi:hypothetical protein
MEGFTPTDAHGAHVAMIDMLEAAKKHRERKPQSNTGCAPRSPLPVRAPAKAVGFGVFRW